MSLQVWLPLNGNLNNQGLANVSHTAGTPQYKTPGKISNNALDLKTRIYFSCEKLANLQTFSVAFWALAGSSSSLTTNWQDLIGFVDVSSGGTAGTFRWETTYASANGIHWHDNTTNAFVNSSHNHITVKDVWVHCCVVFNNELGKIYSYDNGVLKQIDTHLGGKFNSTGSFYLGETNNIEGMIQDVRFYDHALSTKEVEEISKGLVLHYKLDDRFCESTINLSNKLSDTAYNGANGKYGYNTDSNMQKTSGFFQGKQCEKVSMITAGQSARPYIYISNMFVSSSADYATYKTLSFDYYATIGTYINPYKLGSGTSTATYIVINNNGTQNGNFTNSGNIPIIANEWNHIEFTMQGTTTESAQWGYIINGNTHTSTTTDYWLFANIQVEEKDHATGYTGSGGSRVATTIYDSSGYNNNGTIVGSLEITTSSPRYSYATHFDGVTSCIKIPYDEINPDRIFTVNLWFYKNALGSKNYETLFGGPSGFEMDTRAGTATTLSLYMASTRGGAVYSPLNLNEWTMITMVRDGTNEFYYVNGELKKTIEAKSMPSGQYRIGAWASDTGQNYYGEISDFRIYATALTTEQVKELYNTSMTIDNQGNIHARELVE